MSGSVVARALTLLGAFSANAPRLTLSEIARRSGVPLSSAHCLVAGLCEWGALERAADGRYEVGLRLWEVGALAPRGTGLRERALPVLEDLRAVTGETVQLAVREGSEVVYLERLAGSDGVPVLTRVGGRFTLTCTGVGLALLAHAPHEVADRVLAAELPRHTPFTLTRPADVRRALAAVRTRGYAVSDRQVTADAISVAAPIADRRGAVVAAMSIVARADRKADVRAFASLVMTSARAIGRCAS